jgi:hypothetical protein
MNDGGRRCQFCDRPIYGRSDKRYCSATCRRDACRTRTRVIRVGEYEYVGSEWRDAIERVLIPSLEREYGPNHRVVVQARRAAEERDEAWLERIIREMNEIEARGRWSSDDEG